MEMNEKIQLLKDRFIHRTDAYALQWYAEHRGTGYAKQKIMETDETAPINDWVIQRHIEQEITIGIYQLDESSTVKWLCLDVDLKKGVVVSDLMSRKLTRQQTLVLVEKLKAGGIPFLVEQSGSKGYHLWVFFSEPVAAKDAAALAQWVLQGVVLPNEISIEVFPKQTTIRAYGNLVKMPLSLHRKTLQPCYFIGADWQPKEDQWTTLAGVTSIAQKHLLSFIRNNAIEVMEPVVIEDRPGFIGTTTPPCIPRMMSEGLENGHLDVGLFKLSCYLRDRGFPQDMARASLQTMLHRSKSPRWTEQLLDQKIESAYARQYTALPCSEALLDSYCSSSCRFFRGKLEQRLGKNTDKTAAIGVLSRD